MDTTIAGRIAQFAEVTFWLYLAIGLFVFWGYSFFLKDSKLLFPIFRRPTLSGALLLIFVWFLDGLSSFMAKRLVENTVSEGALATVIAKPLAWHVLLHSSVEELARGGFYQLFASLTLVGVWLNSFLFGVAHLSGRTVEIANHPLILLFLPLSSFATGLSLLAVIMRMGLVWAILLHFAVNTVRFVVITENIVVNYLLFFASVLCLLWIGSLNLRKAIFDQRVQEKDLDP
ncbi:hypothetical protein [Meiothermus sp. CFH 77666]|uniref:hypothetical protein n=1 Tax=Meiothermus sp. CFH 77666 TaxID=2817942 RepID=UPI001AA081DD|nr:hypothetical protein [Meiothermus sp. CFH 77666]MBO1435824.1 hypothetical protein [Meiothermus sp. CFH 77666]